MANRLGAVAIAALAMGVGVGPGRAATAVIDPAEMNAIFSQASFGSTPISIRFNATKVIEDPSLLVIKDLADLTALANLAPDPAPVVDAFFVDQIDACGFPEMRVNGYYAGCAQLPGHVFVEESGEAEKAAGPLMAHELGHNLNLNHDLFSAAYLMWPLFPPGTLVTTSEVATILKSPLVQTDASGQRFIEITPIEIVGAPEPAALGMVAMGLGLLAGWKRVRGRSARAS